MYKAVFVLCAQALFLQIALCHYISQADSCSKYPLGYIRESLGYYGSKCPYGFSDNWRLNSASGFGDCYGGALEYSPTSGSGIAVSCGSTIAPVSLSVVSEIEYKGQLASTGALPFIGSVGVKGVLPTVGAGAIRHHCGNGIDAVACNGLGCAGGFECGCPDAYGLGVSARRFGSCGAPKHCGC